MMRRPRFFYLLRTQYENLGDRIINRECLALLRGYGTVRVNVVGVPQDFVAGLSLSPGEACAAGGTFYRELFAARLAGEVVYLVLVPGAVMGAAQFVRQTVLVVGYAALKALGVRIIRIGASLGPFTPLRLQMERWKARMMAFIGLRDRRSLDYAREHGFPNAAPFRDFAFMLPTQLRRTGAEGGPLVLSFRAEDSDELDAIAVSISRFLARIDPEATRPLTIASQVERDRLTGRALAARVAGGRPVGYLDAADGEPALFDGYAGSAGVLSNRLHVLMFALSVGAPVRGLVHPTRNRKIIGLFEDAGLGDRLVEITDPDAVDAVPWPDRPADPAIFSTERRALVEAFETMVAR